MSKTEDHSVRSTGHIQTDHTIRQSYLCDHADSDDVSFTMSNSISQCHIQLHIVHLITQCLVTLYSASFHCTIMYSFENVAFHYTVFCLTVQYSFTQCLVIFYSALFHYTVLNII